MKIAGKILADLMIKQLKKERQKIKKNLRLTVFLIGQSADQLSYVKIKRRLGRQIKVDFDLVHLKSTPTFENFMFQLKEKSQDPATTGIIIQQPLPTRLSTTSIYDYIPLEKEIEGHRHKSFFYPPIGLAVLTVFKYIFKRTRSGKALFINPEEDKLFFKTIFHNKRIVLIGRGLTGGGPIGQTLSEFKINYLNTHSRTPQPENYYKEADIIISAVGKKVIQPEFLKPGVILINIGLRREGNKLKGDYEENEIKKIASFYTPTPGGIGPIDVVYLYKNLIEAHKLQR